MYIFYTNQSILSFERKYFISLFYYSIKYDKSSF